MNDLISRRKAFEYFVTLWECIGTIMDRDEWEDVCMTTANEIPSAQPKERTEERAETHACDLIDRQAAIDAVNNLTYPSSLVDVKRILVDLPSAQPEQDIEHCATCVHDEDSVEICVLRKCKYAIAELIDCYEPKQPERMTNR